jgi:hypothetical protein
MGMTAWQAGQRITASRLNQITPIWSSWTPTWTTSSGAATPSFGNAVITAMYAQVADVVMYRMEITFGTTTSFGGGGASDNWRFSTPVTASATANVVGFGEAQDSSVAGSLGRVALRTRLTSTTTFELEVSGGRPDAVAIVNGGLIDAISPWTWASTDIIRVFGEYQAA